MLYLLTFDFREQQELRAVGLIAFLLAAWIQATQAQEQAADLDQVQKNLVKKSAVKPDAAVAPKTPSQPEKIRQDNKKSGLFVEEPEPACGEE